MQVQISPCRRLRLHSEFMGKTFKSAQLTHERFLTIDHSLLQNIFDICQTELMSSTYFILMVCQKFWQISTLSIATNIFHKALIIKENFNLMYESSFIIIFCLQSMQHPSTRPLIDRFLNVSDVFMIQMLYPMRSFCIYWLTLVKTCTLFLFS